MLQPTNQSVQTRAHKDNQAYYGLDTLGEAGLVPRPTSITDVPPYGVAVMARDRALRRLWRLNGMEPITAAISSYIQKLQATDWLLEGESAIAQMMHQLLHAADFGQGWEEFISRTLTDYLTSDNGMFIELIGGGNPAGPLRGSVQGIAHLESIKCQRTGNLEYPVIYTDLQGIQHKIHTTRVMFQADMPDPDERRYGVGFCALSRAASVAQRLFNWAEMSGEFMDDFPASGILVVKSMAKKLFDDQMRAYQAGRAMKEEEIYHGLVTLFFQNGQVNDPVQLVPFRQLWEGFGEREMYDIIIDLVAMAFNIDRQELAPLSSSGLGSGAQSGMLNQKSRGKGIAAVMNMYERIVNRIMPSGVTFRFDFIDQEQALKEAEIQQMKANTVISLFAAGAKPQPSMQIDGMVQNKPAKHDTTKPVPEGKFFNGGDTSTSNNSKPTPPAPPSEPLITREEARYMLVKDGVIPREIYELDAPLQPNWQRFDDITIKRVAKYGPRVVIDRVGTVSFPRSKWGDPHRMPQVNYA